jgi:hypothetical protein
MVFSNGFLTKLLSVSFSNADAIQTYRIREIKNSSQHAYYGRESDIHDA